MLELIQLILKASAAGEIKVTVPIDDSTSITLNGLAGSFRLEEGKFVVNFNGTMPHVTKSFGPLGIIKGGVNLSAIEIDSAAATAIGSNGKKYKLTEL